MQDVVRQSDHLEQGPRRFVSRDLRGRMCRCGYYNREFKLHGRECYWDDFGVMARTIEWRNGIRHGETTTYNSLGQKLFVALWDEGCLKQITRFDTASAWPIFSYTVQYSNGVVIGLPVFLRAASQ